MNEMSLSALKQMSQDFKRWLYFEHVPLVQLWDLGLQPGLTNIYQKRYRSGKIEVKGLKKKLVIWTINGNSHGDLSIGCDPSHWNECLSSGFSGRKLCVVMEIWVLDLFLLIHQCFYEFLNTNLRLVLKLFFFIYQPTTSASMENAPTTAQQSMPCVENQIRSKGLWLLSYPICL